MTVKQTRKVNRSADTGKFVPESEAQKHPKTTVTETITITKKPIPKKGKK